MSLFRIFITLFLVLTCVVAQAEECQTNLPKNAGVGYLSSVLKFLSNKIEELESKVKSLETQIYGRQSINESKLHTNDTQVLSSYSTELFDKINIDDEAYARQTWGMGADTRNVREDWQNQNIYLGDYMLATKPRPVRKENIIELSFIVYIKEDPNNPERGGIALLSGNTSITDNNGVISTIYNKLGITEVNIGDHDKQAYTILPYYVPQTIRIRWDASMVKGNEIDFKVGLVELSRGKQILHFISLPRVDISHGYAK